VLKEDRCHDLACQIERLDELYGLTEEEIATVEGGCK